MQVYFEISQATLASLSLEAVSSGGSLARINELFNLIIASVL
jgi:hypothetical protein